MKVKLAAILLTGIFLNQTSLVMAARVETNKTMKTGDGINSDNTMMGTRYGNSQDNTMMGSRDRIHTNNGMMGFRDRDAQRKNEHKDSVKALAADQQANDRKDLGLTQRIRKDLVEDDYLSTYAKNVRIDTKQGKVILTGLVNSEKEKNSVVKIAKNLAGSQNVESKITITK